MLIAVTIGAVTGCKPTEKNYSSAYEVAKQKRERDEAHRRELQAEMGVDFDKLQSVDNTNYITIEVPDSLGGSNIRMPLKNASFNRADQADAYLAAVAMFKMRANASSLAEDLRSEGFPAARALTSGDNFYVVIEEGKNPEALLPDVIRFVNKFKDFTYVGTGEILILRRIGPGK